MLSIILLNYNNTEDTVSCVRDILNQKFNTVEIIIIENKSEDNQRKKLVDFYNELKKRSKADIKLLLSKKNLGFTGGNNLGARFAKGDVILFLNNDTILTEGFLRESYNELVQHKNIAVLGPKILSYPQTEKIWSAGGFYKPFTIDFVQNRGYGEAKTKYNQLEIVDFIAGTAFFIKKEVLDDVGGFENDYFIYFEESELCLRLKRRGYKLLYFPRAKIYHKVGVNPRYKQTYFKLEITNRVTTAFKHLSRFKLIGQLFLSFLYSLRSLGILTFNRIKYNPLGLFYAYIAGIKKGIIRRSPSKKYKFL